MPPKKSAAATKKAKRKTAKHRGNSSSEENNSSNTGEGASVAAAPAPAAGRSRAERAAAQAARREAKSAAVTGPTKYAKGAGTLALCLRENQATKRLKRNYTILKCLGIKRGVSVRNATMGFEGNGAFNRPESDYKELHLCRGSKTDKVPDVAGVQNIPQKPFRRALFRCYAKGKTVEELERKVEEGEFGEENNSSPESLYSGSRAPSSKSSATSKESSKSETSSASSSSAESRGNLVTGAAANGSAGSRNTGNGSSSRTGPAYRTRSRSVSSMTIRKRVNPLARVAYSPEKPGIAKSVKRRMISLANIKRGLAKTRRLARPRTPSPPKGRETVTLSPTVAAARGPVTSFLAEGSVAAKRRAFEEEAARIAAAAAALKARSPVSSLKRAASGP